MRTLTNCVLVTCVMLAACSKELSRSEVERKIALHEKMVEWSWYLPFHKRSVADGAKQGYFRYDRKSDSLMLARPIENVTTITSEWIELQKPTTITITATGISDVPGTTNLKEARFEWRYQNLSSILKRFSSVGGNGMAVFRLFDDGWRVDRVDTTVSEDRIPLSDREIDEIEADVAAELEKCG